MSQIPLDRSLLASVELFRGFDDAMLDQALLMAQRRRIRAGAAAFEQDQPADAFFVLVSGRLKVSQVTPAGQQVVVRFIGPRDFFGCVTMYGRARYPGTALAIEDSLALAWTRNATAQLLSRQPQMAINAMGAVAERLQESQARVRELSTEKVDQRIAHALVRLAAQAGRRDREGVRIGFRISRQDIAEMVGSTLHTVSRTLSAWEDGGIVRNGRQSVVIRDAAALEALAGEPVAA